MASACSRCASEEAGKSLSTPGASDEARAAESPALKPGLETSATAPIPPAPPVTPKVPPEVVACGEREFHRISESSLDGFEIARELPPPQIRGSRVARQTTKLEMEEPRNLISLSKKSLLVIAKAGVFRYELGQKSAKRYGSIPSDGPLAAWPDPRRPDSFLVRSDGALHEYTLAGAPSVESDSAKLPAKLSGRVAPLPGFDARLFTVLANGTPLYSTPKGLVRRGDESHPVPFLEATGQATFVFADVSLDRHWTADASGKLALWDRKQSGSPTSKATVPGAVIDTALAGERVAVLSIALDGQAYQPIVTIFSNGNEVGRLAIGPTIGAREQPKLDVCLLSGGPWVVVGNTRWLQLLDWESRRLLAEW